MKRGLISVPITKNEFREAIRKVVSSEFEHVPTDENAIDYTFSAGFMKRMQRLFRNHKKSWWKLVNTVGKRVAVIFIAAALLFATACSFKSIREPIMRFITEVYETFTSLFVDGDTVDTIEKIYSLETPPEGFVQKDRLVSEALILTTYENAAGDTITISQVVTDKSNVNLDREVNDIKIETVGEIEIVINRVEEKTQIIWFKDQYYFEITSTGNQDLEMLKAIVTELK